MEKRATIRLALSHIAAASQKCNRLILRETPCTAEPLRPEVQPHWRRVRRYFLVRLNSCRNSALISFGATSKPITLPACTAFDRQPSKVADERVAAADPTPGRVLTQHRGGIGAEDSRKTHAITMLKVLENRTTA
jgi:hypothetical protein